MELKITYLPTGDLIPYARNSRTHTDEQVAQVAASIREFGFASPVLIGMHIKECELKTFDVIIQRWQNLTGKQATMDGKTYDQLREERNGTPSA